MGHNDWTASEAGQCKGAGGKAEHSESRREKEQSEVGFLELIYLQTQVTFTSRLLETKAKPCIAEERGKSCEPLLSCLTQITEPPLWSAGRVWNGSKIMVGGDLVGFYLKIIEPQDALGWKGPLKFIWSNLPAMRRDTFTGMRRKSLSHGPSKSKVMFQLQGCHCPTSSNNIVTGLKLWQQIKCNSPGKYEAIHRGLKK